jgi:hypothetical protein
MTGFQVGLGLGLGLGFIGIGLLAVFGRFAFGAHR